MRLLLLFMLLPALVFSQSPEEDIDPENINVQYLEHLIKKKIDSVRHSKGLIELVNDSILYLASGHHSAAMAKTRSLSHYEALSKFKNPQKRADAFGAQNYFTGENVAFLTTYIKLNNKHPELSEYFTYGGFATKMVKGWVRSRGHYRNIIHKEYQVTGVSIAYDKKTKRIYATQMFADVKSKFVFTENTGMFPYEEENEVEYELKALKQVARKMHKGPHRWHLKPRKKFSRCRQCDAVTFQKDKIGFYVDDQANVHCVTNSGPLFKRLTRRPKDGFALEVVHYRDYECGNKNFFLTPSRRNAQCIANGTVQQPVYKWKLRKQYRKDKLAWNRVKWSKIRKIILRFKFKKYHEAFKAIPAKFPGTPQDNIIGQLPLNDSDYYELNLLCLKKKRVCVALKFSDYCGQYFNTIRPTPVLPERSGLEYRYPEDTVRYEFNVYFKQGKSDYKEGDIKPLLDTLRLQDYSVVKLRIHATASVEGEKEINERLTLRRAMSIRRVLDSTRVDSLVGDIQAKEDWEHFYKNVATTNYKNFTKLSKQAIKKELEKPEVMQELAGILDQERKAFIKLWLMKKVPDSVRVAHACKRYRQLMDSAAKGKPSAYYASRLHSIQTLLYDRARQGKIPFSILTETAPPTHPVYAKVYLNYMVFRRMEDTSATTARLSDQVLYEVLRGVALTRNASAVQRYNFISLLTNYWDSTAWYGNWNDEKIQPKKIFNLLGRLGSGIPKDTLDQLKLNFYFKAANWFYFIDYDENFQARAMNNIYYHYRKRVNTDSMAYKMARYFIFYGKDNYAYRILAPFALKKDPNHEVFSLYLKMAYLKDMYRSRSRFFRLMRTATTVLNQKEYCDLFTGPCNISFQIFDNEEIRTTWCKTCAGHYNFAEQYRDLVRARKKLEGD